MTDSIVNIEPEEARRAANHLRMLAEYFDARDKARGYTDTEVQDDLTAWADALDSAIKLTRCKVEHAEPSTLVVLDEDDHVVGGEGSVVWVETG